MFHKNNNKKVNVLSSPCSHLWFDVEDVPATFVHKCPVSFWNIVTLVHSKCLKVLLMWLPGEGTVLLWFHHSPWSTLASSVFICLRYLWVGSVCNLDLHKGPPASSTFHPTGSQHHTVGRALLLASELSWRSVSVGSTVPALE